MDDSPTHSNTMDSEVREQDRLLPIANVSRIMKCALPDNAKIAKDAKETVQDCVSEFILFVTSEAADRCQQEKRKTINGEDLLWAIQSLGFDNYVEPLKLFLARYREQNKFSGQTLHREHHLHQLTQQQQQQQQQGAEGTNLVADYVAQFYQQQQQQPPPPPDSEAVPAEDK